MTPNPIIIAPYDPTWPDAFTRAAAKVAPVLGSNLLALRHIGSTSIPGMYAKPVIDMLAVVADLAAVDACTRAMQSLGYEVMGEFGIAGRRYAQSARMSGGIGTARMPPPSRFAAKIRTSSHSRIRSSPRVTR